MWAEELQHIELSHDFQKAEQFLRLHNESFSQMQNTTFQILQQGQELLQARQVEIVLISSHKFPYEKRFFSFLSANIF